MDQDKTPKANWDAFAARVFCEICAKEKLAGNRRTAFLSPTGYKNLESEFSKQTGRNYTKKQFKNRWDAMKSLYLAWRFFKDRATGLGWDSEKRTVSADDDWWKQTIDHNKLCESFRKGPSEFMDELEIMFEKAHADGKSSVMPGVSNEAQVVIDDDDEVEEVEASPRIGNAKRGTAKCEDATSTKKNKKSPMQRDFKHMVDHYISDNNSVTSSTNVTVASEIEAIMEKVVECGAPEGSDEYYIATKLFAKLENQVFFYTIKTTEGRLNWLTRQYSDRRRN